MSVVMDCGVLQAPLDPDARMPATTRSGSSRQPIVRNGRSCRMEYLEPALDRGGPGMDDAPGRGEPTMVNTHEALVAPTSVEHLLTDPAASLLRQIADEMIPRADRIADSMLQTYTSEIPAYGSIDDEPLREDVHAVSSAMVRGWLTVMSTGATLDDELLDVMIEGARRRAVQGLDMQSMLRAFRVGVRVLWCETTRSPLWRHPALQASLAQVATWALEFADRICTAVAAAYLDESSEIARQRAHRRSALLDVILSPSRAPMVDRPAELCIRHSIACVRMGEDLTLRELERTGELLESEAGAVLWTVRFRSLVAVVSWPDGVRRDDLCQRLQRFAHVHRIEAVGLGGMAENVAESQQSYCEALQALRVGPSVTGLDNRVFDHQALAPLIALLHQPDQGRRFANAALEPLGQLVRRAWVLPTLEAHLLCHGHVKQVASMLNVHQSTVKYRLRELRATAGPAFAEGDAAVTVLMALKVLHALRGSPYEGTHRCAGPGRDVPDWSIMDRSETFRPSLGSPPSGSAVPSPFPSN